MCDSYFQESFSVGLQKLQANKHYMNIWRNFWKDSQQTYTYYMVQLESYNVILGNQYGFQKGDQSKVLILAL